MIQESLQLQLWKQSTYIKNKSSSNIYIKELYLVGKIKDKHLRNKLESLIKEIRLNGIKL